MNKSQADQAKGQANDQAKDQTNDMLLIVKWSARDLLVNNLNSFR